MDEHNGRHFTNDIFIQWHFFRDTFCLLIQTSPILVLNGPIDSNRSALVRVMAWHRTGVKPLAESMMSQFIDAYKSH